MGKQPPQITEPIPIAKMWKSPRNRRQAIHFTLQQYEGHPYLDVRVYTLNGAGQAVPTKAGVTVNPAGLEEFSEAIAKAVVKAREIGLLDGKGVDDDSDE
jgi:hypothetical protein